MIKSLSFWIFLLLSISAHAQINISGTVVDEQKTPLPFVTVTLLHQRDSTMIAYDSTNEKGEFHLKTNHPEKVILQANYIGYQTESQNIDLQDNTNLVFPIILKEGRNVLDEILIKARDTGITFANDTIKYNVKKFTDGTETNLGDVLDKLPGIEVDEKGSIKSGGKQVGKLMLNGQDYFGNNTQIATQNIPAEAVENVEVLNNYSEYSLLKGFQTREQTVINVLLDKKWSDKLSGELSLQGDFKDTYNSKLNLMSMHSTYMVSLIGSQNNLGNEAFSIEDYYKLQGGVTTVMASENNIVIGLTEDEKQMLLPQRNTLKRANGLSALNFNYQPKDYFKINSYLLYHNDKSQLLNSNEYLFPNQLTTTEETHRIIRNDLFSAFLKINYDKIRNTSLVYNGTISNTHFNEENDITFHQFNSINNFYETNKRKPIKTKNILSAIKKINKNILITEMNFNYHNMPTDYQLHYDTLYIKPFPTSSSGTLPLRQNTYNSILNSGLSFTFLYQLNEQYFINTKIYNQYNRREYSSNLEQSPFIPNSSNDSYLNSNVYGVDLSWNKNKGIVRFKGGASFDSFYFQGGREPATKKLFKINPAANFTLLFDEKHSLNLTYNQHIRVNNADLYTENPVVVDFRTLYNPNFFDQTHYIEQEFKMRYFFFESFSNFSIVVVGLYNRYKHQNTRNIFQDYLTTSYEIIESPQTDRLVFNTSITKGLYVIPWSIEFRGGYVKFNHYNYINDRENELKHQQSTARLLLKSKYKTKINTELFFDLNHTKSQSGINTPFYQSTQGVGTKFIYKINKNILFDLNYEYKTNLLSLYDKSVFNILSGKLSYNINKQFELSLVGDNLLNLQSMQWNSISYREDYILRNNFAQIPGYVLLGLKYKI